MTPGSDVFISYVADTLPLAKELTRFLEEEGISAWTDFKDLHAGQRWEEQITRALARANLLLFLVSPSSRTTQWQDWEMRSALETAWSDSEKIVIPVVVGAGEPPPFLRSWVPLRIDPDTEPADWTLRVLQALRGAKSQVPRILSSDEVEREQRLNEIAGAAEKLAERESRAPRKPREAN